jgi:hypothetical protein
MVDRLVAADRVITEQLLGWTWTPPVARGGSRTLQEQESQKDSLTTPGGHQDGPSSAESAASAGGTSSFVPSSIDEAYPAARVLAHSDESKGASDGDEGASDGSPVPAELHRGKMRGLLMLLVHECGRFLLDAATQAACERLEASDDGRADLAAVIRADAVLHAIGCTSLTAASSLLHVCEERRAVFRLETAL